MNTHKQALEKYKAGFSDPNGSYYDSTLNIMISWVALMLNLGGNNLHIGYDHRGTMIEMEVQRGQKYSNELAKSCFESMKKLVDLYKKKTH